MVTPPSSVIIIHYGLRPSEQKSQVKHGPFQPAKAGMAKREMPPVAPLLASKDAIISSTVSWLSRSSTLSSSLASGFLQVDPTRPRKVESQDQRR